MRLLSLEVQNYRNIASASLTPGRELTVICGNNGQGKTNLLEAIWLLTGGKSFRGGKDAELVRRFNGGEVSVFLISLRAGGTGLNLTAADIVIHYDPWWNVAAQNQATDRAYRIGQQNPVQVYKLIAQDTIEEKIVALQQAKQSLAETVTGSADGAILSMKPEELLELLEVPEP
jgi:ABC-type cobalamin/Fe3+-siderophores transport system ATPase subunit